MSNSRSVWIFHTLLQYSIRLILFLSWYILCTTRRLYHIDKEQNPVIPISEETLASVQSNVDVIIFLKFRFVPIHRCVCVCILAYPMKGSYQRDNNTCCCNVWCLLFGRFWALFSGKENILDSKPLLIKKVFCVNHWELLTLVIRRIGNSATSFYEPLYLVKKWRSKATFYIS